MPKVTASSEIKLISRSNPFQGVSVDHLREFCKNGTSVCFTAHADAISAKALKLNESWECEVELKLTMLRQEPHSSTQELTRVFDGYAELKLEEKTSKMAATVHYYEEEGYVKLVLPHLN